MDHVIHPTPLSFQRKIEDWGIESEDDIQVNCILQELIPMSVMQAVTAKEHDLQQLKEDIIHKKKCRKDLTSFRGIFHVLSHSARKKNCRARKAASRCDRAGA